VPVLSAKPKPAEKSARPTESATATAQPQDTRAVAPLRHADPEARASVQRAAQGCAEGRAAAR
jgi:hypothetical protein